LSQLQLIDGAALQVRDFLRAEAEFGQNLLGLLAELRRPRRHFAWRAR